MRARTFTKTQTKTVSWSISNQAREGEAPTTDLRMTAHRRVSLVTLQGKYLHPGNESAARGGHKPDGARTHLHKNPDQDRVLVYLQSGSRGRSPDDRPAHDSAPQRAERASARRAPRAATRRQPHGRDQSHARAAPTRSRDPGSQQSTVAASTSRGVPEARRASARATMATK